MAVVQISRIQIRRGKSQSGTGLPQLASGELAWALDTQELYIGNGSVAEGAPAVGNTKVLTERDLTVQGNILNLIQHIYKSNDPGIVTGPSVNTPVSRYLQDRLDDRVSGKDFGIVADGVTDDTEALQRAISQLFLNPISKASEDTPDGTDARVVLQLLPGVYNITDTIYIPSYATIVGAGLEKTIIKYTGTGPAIRFINDSSTLNPDGSVNASELGNTIYIQQPRHIRMHGLTIWSDTNDQIGMQMDAVRDSVFENIYVKGSWEQSYNANSIGIALNAVSSLVTCERNLFKNVYVTGFSFGVQSKYDILDNTFDQAYVKDARYGFVIGATLPTGTNDSNGSSVGQQYGSRNTVIKNAYFDDIKRQGVYVGLGVGNIVEDSKFINVGNDGGGHSEAVYPQVYFNSYGNTDKNNYSDRSIEFSKILPTVTLTLTANVTATKGVTVVQAVNGSQGVLLNSVTNTNTIVIVSTDTFDTTHNLTINGDATPSVTNSTVRPSLALPVSYVSYVPEFAGLGEYHSFGTKTVQLGVITGYGLAFRLPVSTSPGGTPVKSISYNISYMYRSNVNDFSRQGKLSLAVDVENVKVQLSDEYDFAGLDPLNTDDPSDAISTKLAFRATLLNENGQVLGVGDVPYTIAVEYTNTLAADSGVLSYSYIAKS